jgi:hypothetical protein
MAKHKTVQQPYRARQSESTDVEDYFRDVFTKIKPASLTLIDNKTPADGTVPSPGISASPGTVPSPAPMPSPGIYPAPQPGATKERRIHRCSTAQHGHSSNEQLIYQFLWSNGRPENSQAPNGTRLIAIGIGTIAKSIGTIHERNVTVIIQRLIAKQAIEIARHEISDERKGRQYRVFSYDAILERRRRVGMEWVKRSSRGVDFVNPNTGEPIDLPKRNRTASPGISAGDGISTPDGISASDGITPSDAVISPAPPGITSGESPGISAGALEKAKRKHRETSSDALIRQTLAQYGVVDDDAVYRLNTGVKRACSDATELEIVHFIDVKGSLIRKRGSAIDNPIGFLVTSVPKCFEGESFKRYRDEQGRELSPELASAEERALYWGTKRILLENP